MAEEIVRAPRKDVPVFAGPQARSMDRVLTEDQLTPYERSQLTEKFGYVDGPVPSNLPSLLSETEKRAAMQLEIEKAANTGVEGFKLPSRGIDPDNIPTIRDDAKVEAAFAAVAARMGNMFNKPEKSQTPDVNSVFEQARTAGIQSIQRAGEDAAINPNIAKAMSDLETELHGSPGMAPRQQSSEDQAEQVEKERQSKQDAKYDLLKSKVDPDDAEAYREAVYAFARFEKSYSLFGGDVRVTFGSYGADEDAMIVNQEAIDAFYPRINRRDLPSVLMNSARYTFAASLREVHIVSKGLSPVEIPASQSVAEFLAGLPREAMGGLTGFTDEDTNIRMWHQFLSRKAIPDTLYRVLFKKYEEFRATLTHLEQLAQYPRFFGRPTQSS